MPKRALIVGATGLVGNHCLNELFALENVSLVRALVRKPLPENNKLESCIVDFEKLDDYEQLFDVDVVICSLGTTLKQAGSVEAFKRVDYDYCLKVAELAKSHHVKHFEIVTAVNSNANSFAYYSKIKGKLQKALIALKFNQLSIFQPSLLLGERENFRLGEGMFASVSGVMNKLIPSSMNAFKAIPGEVVGRSMAILASQDGDSLASEVTFYRYDDMYELINQGK